MKAFAKAKKVENLFDGFLSYFHLLDNLELSDGDFFSLKIMSDLWITEVRIAQKMTIDEYY